MPNTSRNTFSVKIQTPDSLVWEGRAESLSSENSAGRFDVLSEHGNMITIIEKKPIEIVTAGGTRKFTFDKAVLSINNDVVTIFANIGVTNFPTKNRE